MFPAAWKERAMYASLSLNRKRDVLAPQGLNYILQALSARSSSYSVPGENIASVLKNWTLLEWEISQWCRWGSCA